MVSIEYPGFGYPEGVQLSAFASWNQISFPRLLAERELAAEFVNEHIDVAQLTFTFRPDRKSTR
ncbi:MAG: hypothetical protein VCB07_10145, partial [Gammaproteobacteria bacterium]